MKLGAGRRADLTVAFAGVLFFAIASGAQEPAALDELKGYVNSPTGHTDLLDGVGLTHDPDLARAYGDGSLRMTADQNLLFRWVPNRLVQALYRQLAAACDYPLHLGVTEAGPAFQGTVKSAVAFGALLAEGIGDTIRVSLSAPPVEEVKVGISILESLGMRQRRLEIVSCPSCGRAQVDVYKLAEEVTAGLEGMEVPLRVAVMGCVVNGPGEAREADLGVASGNGKGQIFVRGKVIATVPESQIVETLIEEAMRLAEQGAVSGEGAEGQPVVTTY
jgi:dissimilatory sulfite reductase (desulfoviridin) alpha/beta subunit